ncbi:hypothetical protein EW146_g1163 [Bondarzewia mesenterica]|uniref:Far11/STRP C-terminal domain-containing protein n=1 Tax=Bondarzewia mesenterica TaxID=1095465 RepID=A0A4S4M4W1_9AGAM|nr:hypothetical protein EW146_g1163 [Bondarzewia mesenterica]
MSGDLDSITLGQLKAMVVSAPKPKASLAHMYDDEDTVLNEIEEFYSYVEMPQVEENLRAWEGSFQGEWIKSDFSKRKAHVEVLLESLEHKDAVIRFTNARRLLYILQGTFAETTSPEHQLHWIFENCKVVRAANGVSNIVEAMKIASSKHDLLVSLSDADSAQFGISVEEKVELVEEFTTEISVYLAMLYHLIETFKGHEDFAEELMSLDPPLPVYFFNVVSGLRDRNAKRYPVKKVLSHALEINSFVLWGHQGASKSEEAVARIGWAGSHPGRRCVLLNVQSTLRNRRRMQAIPIKSSPLDIEAFHQEISVKYPTFSAPSVPPTASGPDLQFIVPVPTAQLAEAYNPIPIRHHYHHDEPESQQGGPHFQPSQMQSGFRGMPQPATPAPSPPPSPKPKKQQYQTDPSRPFLFPFSRRRTKGRDMMLVPFAIEEADKLYNKHIHISLALWQMWKIRDECMTAESGLDHLRGMEGMTDSLTKMTMTNEEGMVAEGEILPDMALLNAKIAETEAAIKNTESSVERRQLKQRREDLMRLKWVEQIYDKQSAVLPSLSSWVLVLLKFLLAIVSASSPNQPPPSAASSGFPPGVPSREVSYYERQPTQIEDIDVVRHREIITKAVSAMLLLMLKWFKVSHVMKFHNLGQHMLDTNCLLLMMKTFGMQDVSLAVVSKADSPENNFFRYCLNFSKNRQSVRMEDEMLSPPRRTVTRTTVLPNGMKSEEDVDMLTEFSWRNFFSTINLAKVMQKLSKHRSHRIRMLVQYKSATVLKRILKIQHTMLQLHILKLIKSQVPFSGRKWRQSNMQVITSIYLHCRPDLRDEWLTGNEVDDIGEGQAQEQALRQLVKFYNTKRYGQQVSHAVSHAHRRSISMSHSLEGLHAGPELSGFIRPVGTPNVVEADVFPPLRAQAPDPNIFLPYITEDIAFEEEYEEYLSDLGWSDTHTSDGPPAGSSNWHRLPEFAADLADGISDSESIASIVDLGDEGRDLVHKHMSPKTMAALTKSPAGPGARRSSSGEKLRPVLPFGLDEVNLAEDLEGEDEGEDLGPMPREQSGPFASGGGVDEVEYAYGV